MKIVLESSALIYASEFPDELKAQFPDVEFVTPQTPEELRRVIRDADGIYGTPDREAFAAAERLRWIANPGVGFDYVMDRPDIVESDVVLTPARAPGYDPHGNGLGDHVFGMILMLAHRWPNLLADQRAHRWGAGNYNNQYVELTGRTMGILAVGAIGSAVARRARGFDMRVIGVDKKTSPVPEGVDEVWGLERLDEALSVSDWFVIAAPRTPETLGLVDARRLSLMKKDAYLIAISRGGIVDEEALLKTLRSGHLAGAGLDVFAQEPLPEDSPLWDQENVIISPHTGHVTPEMPKGHRDVFKENLRRFIAGEPFLYVGDKRTGY
ncbi:MAG: D-2-hydroxyacid dehydrogenase [SAR202 cluster bacterium]|nr:D-2-hydroxyacid dehydrogenase [SAR202 cluster bacterium]